MRLARLLLLAGMALLPLAAQQIKFNFEHLEAKAADTVDVALNGSTLQFAGKFLDSKDPDEVKVKKLIGGLAGIYVKSFTFKEAGAYTKADVDSIRGQLKQPEWTRIVGVKSTGDGDSADIFVRSDNGKITGVTIIATEPKELTVVNIVGQVDLDSLADLSGHFGVPKLETPKKKSKKQ